MRLDDLLDGHAGRRRHIVEIDAVVDDRNLDERSLRASGQLAPGTSRRFERRPIDVVVAHEHRARRRHDVVDSRRDPTARSASSTAITSSNESYSARSAPGPQGSTLIG